MRRVYSICRVRLATQARYIAFATQARCVAFATSAWQHRLQNNSAENGPRAVVEPDGVADFGAEFLPPLARHALGNGRCSDTAWLQTDNNAAIRRPLCLMKVPRVW